MSENEQDGGKGRLSLRPAGRMELGRTVDAGSVRQSFSHGRSKVVQVEVRKKRSPVSTPGAAAGAASAPATGRAQSQVGRPPAGARALTAAELATRQRALVEQQRENARREAERREQEKISILSAAEEARRREEEARKAAEEEARRAAEAAAQQKAEEQARKIAEATSTAQVAAPPAGGAVARGAEEPRRRPAPAPAATPAATPSTPSETLRLKPGTRGGEDEEEARPVRRTGAGPALPPRKPQVAAPKKGADDRRRPGRIDVQAAIEGEDERVRSLASVRRQRERERRQAELERLRSDQVKVVRDVVLPDAITVQELANRMAARTPEVIKALMKLGVMATITQSLDADTAELVVQEFGHRSRRVSESDVEQGLEGVADIEADLDPRPPVVTIMGHVDHGKTSLLDALRKTDVAAGEAGGITQHIGAYKVTTPSGHQITFIDTPGHEAFTAMRARGASVTDIVVLVVAADDGVMPQTIEAIKHAKAAGAPIIVAINKMDKPDANPARVRTELLSHDVVVEDMGGETQDVLVSATKRTGLDKLQEAILLQAEILDLKANPHRAAEGSVIESRLDRGRGPVATVLVQKGTLRQGDIIVAGAEWGRVRAMLDDKGRALKDAGPSAPAEVQGLTGVPVAGEPFVVVENEGRAREVAEFRTRKQRDKVAGANIGARGTLDQMLARIQAGEQKEVAVLIKADVQGSAEAIQSTVLKLAHEEVKVRVLHAAVGQITESDIQLAKASDAVIVAFNVRATSQARELAQREGVVRRGAGVRLLRDGTVIHQGELSQLKRFKDDVKEVARNYECGLSFAGFNDLKEGDVVECYETEMVPG